MFLVLGILKLTDDLETKEHAMVPYNKYELEIKGINL